IVQQIDAELEAPGSGKLPVIAAIQDMHGGARRAMGLIGFVLGLPDDIYTRVAKLDDLKALLAEEGIEVGDTAVRFVGLNDKYDRGYNPEGIFELVSWLRREGKAKPFIGNHDFWRTTAVLGVDRLFIKQGIDLNAPGIKSHHIAYWTHEAFHHAGWGDIELEQINQKRFNMSLAVINRILELQGLEGFAPINLAAIRTMHEKDLSDAKKENFKIRQQNELRKEEKGYVRQSERRLVDIFTESLKFLEQKKQEYNRAIGKINADCHLDIPEIEFPEVNQENFWRDPEIMERALWELKNFRIFYVDILGNLHMHNIMPVDYDRGRFIVEYKGMNGLPALELMCEDVRVFFQDLDTIPDSMAFREKMWQELGEAFSIINSWYSDIDAHAKAVSVQKFVENGGLEGLGHEVLGHITQEFVDRESTFLVVWGHNERKKFAGLENPFPWIYLYPELQSGIANIDFEMSEGYSDRGAIVTMFMKDGAGFVSGLRRWGYPEKSGIVQDMTFEDIEGMDEKQLAMLRELSDGKSFMHWYKRKALAHIIEEGGNIALMAAKQGRPDKEFFADKVVNEARINLEIEMEPEGPSPKTYPARLAGYPAIPGAGQLNNLMLYFKGREVLFVAQTETGKIADTVTNPGKISILKGLASRAPPFIPDNPATKSFQILIDDIVRHESVEINTGSHELACRASYDYFSTCPHEITFLFEASERAGLILDSGYLSGLCNFIMPEEKAFSLERSHQSVLDWKRYGLKEGIIKEFEGILRLGAVLPRLSSPKEISICLRSLVIPNMQQIWDSMVAGDNFTWHPWERLDYSGVFPSTRQLADSENMEVKISQEVASGKVLDLGSLWSEASRVLTAIFNQIVQDSRILDDFEIAKWPESDGLNKGISGVVGYAKKVSRIILRSNSAYQDLDPLVRGGLVLLHTEEIINILA
ncbi:MAG: hypothetical protein WC432_06705, partial [Candidatus Omnitrophota bacterium]